MNSANYLPRRRIASSKFLLCIAAATALVCKKIKIHPTYTAQTRRDFIFFATHKLININLNLFSNFLVNKKT